MNGSGRGCHTIYPPRFCRQRTRGCSNETSCEVLACRLLSSGAAVASSLGSRVGLRNNVAPAPMPGGLPPMTPSTGDGQPFNTFSTSLYLHPRNHLRIKSNHRKDAKHNNPLQIRRHNLAGPTNRTSPTPPPLTSSTNNIPPGRLLHPLHAIPPLPPDVTVRKTRSLHAPPNCASRDAAHPHP